MSVSNNEGLIGSDYPVCRASHGCPACGSPKEVGLVMCWLCHRGNKALARERGWLDDYQGAKVALERFEASEMRRLEVLREVLALNYSALGWRLISLSLVEGELSGCIECPCGGAEYFNMMVGLDDIRGLARDILTATASASHLRRDVEAGLLPPFAIERHAFSGQLIEKEA